MYVQIFSQKQLKKRYFGILFMNHSIFVLWTHKNIDSWNVYKEGISSQNEAIYFATSQFKSDSQPVSSQSSVRIHSRILSHQVYV